MREQMPPKQCKKQKNTMLRKVLSTGEFIEFEIGAMRNKCITATATSLFPSGVSSCIQGQVLLREGYGRISISGHHKTN